MNAKTVQLRLRSIPFCVCAIAVSLVSGCAGVQSALDPAGPQAERISRLWWLMFWVCLVVFAAVIVALGYALRRGRRREAPDNSPEAESRTTKIIVGSLAVTVIILFLFMIADFSTGR